MRLALVSDMHGNSAAVDAVVAHVAATGGADRWWVLGDIVALGYDPVGVLERLTTLPNVEFLAGNTERYVLTGERPYPKPADVIADPSLLPRFVECESSFSWTRGVLTQAGWLDWLRRVPARLGCTLPDGTRVLGVHASPGSDDGPGIDPHISDAELGGLLRGCNADVVLGGHTHTYTDRLVGGTRAVNLGCVSNSNRPDRKASFVVIDATAAGYEVEHHLVDYDHLLVLDAIRSVAHPTPRYLSQFHAIAR